MRIVCIGDTHNLHRRLVVPDGDLLLCAGDFSWEGKAEHIADFNAWLGTLPHKWKVTIAGNHELSFDAAKPEFNPATRSLLTNAIYLENSATEIEGVRIWGSPYSPAYCNWAFELLYSRA